MRSISIIPCFKLLNILGFIRNVKTKQIKEIAEIHVMCDMTEFLPPLPPPLPLRPQHYGISSYFNLFIYFFFEGGGVGTLFAHTAQTTSGTWESWRPSERFFITATAVNCVR